MPIRNKVDNMIKKIEEFSEDLVSVLESSKNALIIGHRDADGFSALAIMYNALKSYIPQKNLYWMSFESPVSLARTLRSIPSNKYDLVLILDFGAEREIIEIMEKFRNTFVVDHHLIFPAGYEDRILNPKIFGIMEDSFACSSTLSYYVAKNLGTEIESIYEPPVVGAVGDVQYDYKDENGMVMSLVGFNRIVVDELIEKGFVEEVLSLNLYGKYHKKLSESSRYSPIPFFSEILPIKQAQQHWEKLSDEEKQNIILGAIEHLASMGLKDPETLSKLFIYDYIFPLEKHKFREAKEFATLINNLVRLDLGNEALKIAFELLTYPNKPDDLVDLALKYENKARMMKNKYYSRAKENAKIVHLGKITLLLFLDVSEEEYIHPNATGSVANVLMNENYMFTDLVVVGTYDRKRSLLKVSVRMSQSIDFYSVGDSLSEISKEMGGEGGGHRFAGGCEFRGVDSIEMAKKIFKEVIKKLSSQIIEKF